MKVNLICVGKVKEGFIRGGISHYLTRLKNSRLKIVEVADSNPEKEGYEILKKIRGEDFVVALSEDGKPCSSRDFAALLNDVGKKFVFVIGGPDGLSKEVLSRANITLSLSKMTFTHEMARLLLLEQIYRAVQIIEGRPYHR
ncbi:MAG: 23S rRNA (pseudouridine(1915)-N(3))-methyltransferase RlmH [Methanobacteriota archaeon]